MGDGNAISMKVPAKIKYGSVRCVFVFKVCGIHTSRADQSGGSQTDKRGLERAQHDAPKTDKLIEKEGKKKRVIEIKRSQRRNT